MQTLEGIKKRIQSIKVIKKMTHAMLLVASVKFKKQTKLFKQISDYCHDYYDIFNSLIKSYGCDYPILDANKQKDLPNLYIVVTSNLGLCGSYNSNICKLVIQNLKPNDKMIMFGKKGFLFFKNRNMQDHIIEDFDYEKDQNLYFSLMALAHYINQLFLGYQFKKVYLVYTKFASSIKFIPTIQQILPISHLQFTNKPTTTQPQIIEPNVKKVIEKTMIAYTTNLLYGGVSESILCQYASQKNVMDGASKNASELIDQLKLTFNRLRQETITQEINEIIAGTNSNR